MSPHKTNAAPAADPLATARDQARWLRTSLDELLGALDDASDVGASFDERHGARGCGERAYLDALRTLRGLEASLEAIDAEELEQANALEAMGPSEVGQ